MRYQTWDVLLFPLMSQIPFQEFKTACHVVQDSTAEYVHHQSHLSFIPTNTTFVPAIPAGNPFRVSIHSWETPKPSRYLSTYSKNQDSVIFEARIFIDGKLIACKVFGRDTDWPLKIETGIEVNKHGEVETLKFPAFRREILAQTFWNAGDDLGRIKVVIAEGFPRDSLSNTFECSKNVVAFSFQHAPLDVLEASCIAWPNANMWRDIPFTTPYIPQPPQKTEEEGSGLHSHSPRRRSVAPQSLPPPVFESKVSTTLLSFNLDPFMERSQIYRRHPSSADVSMPDYSGSTSHASGSRQVTDPVVNDRIGRKFDTLQGAGAYESLCEALLPSAPANTPQNIGLRESDDITSRALSSSLSLEQCSTDDRETTKLMTKSHIPGSVKSRKENIHISPQASDSGPSNIDRTRKVAQPFSNKRPRLTTPTSFRAIDPEDEPRSSPAVRKISFQENKDLERRVLTPMEPNVL